MKVLYLQVTARSSQGQYGLALSDLAGLAERPSAIVPLRKHSVGDRPREGSTSRVLVQWQCIGDLDPLSSSRCVARHVYLERPKDTADSPLYRRSLPPC